MPTTTSNVVPLAPMTAAKLALMTPEARAAYWTRVFDMWTRNTAAAMDREYAADRRTARADGDWADAWTT